MAVDAQLAMERARRAYERARGARAGLLSLPVAALSVVACGLGARPTTALGVGAALVIASWFFLWRGQNLGRAVLPGVLAGLVPLALSLGARSFGHVCTGSQCVSLCVPACTIGGLAAGLLIARAGRHVASRPRFYGGAGALAALVGTLGCSCVGYGGIAGLVVGLSITLFPTLVRGGAIMTSLLASILVGGLALEGCSTAATGAPPSPPDASAPPLDGAAVDSAVPPSPPRDAGIVTGPRLLSETGLYSDFAARTLAPGVVPFTVRYPLWSDGSEKSRYLLLPAGTRIDTGTMDDWAFPVGTKAWKEFRISGKLVETRLLWKRRQEEGERSWWMVSYVWRADGSDAEAAPDGVKDVAGTSHDVPSQLGCQTCHTDVRDALVGVSAMQLSTPTNDGPLRRLAAEGRLSAPPPRDFQAPGTGIVQEALGYMHGNCGHCHNERAVRLATQSDMRLRLLVSETSPEQTQIHRTTVGVKMKHIFPPDIDTAVVPGAPEKSELWVRMNLRDTSAMPPLGTEKVDPAGSEAVRGWILGLR